MKNKKYILLFLFIKNNIPVDSFKENNFFIKKISSLEKEIGDLKSEIDIKNLKVNSLNRENEELKKQIKNNPFGMCIQHYREIINNINDEINDLTPGFICWVKNIFSNQDKNKKIAYEKIAKYEEYKKIYKKEAVSFIEAAKLNFIQSLEESIKKIESLRNEKLIDYPNLKQNLIFPSEYDFKSLSRNVEIEVLRILNYLSGL